jgi:hypothetical protein
MVRSVQTVQLSWTKISIVSKQTETSFRLSLIIWEYHPVRPKWFSEAMEHLAQTVHLSWIKISIVSKRTETSFRLSVQNDFLGYGIFGAIHAPILHWN